MTNVTWKKLLITVMVFLAMIAVPVYAAVDARVVSIAMDPASMYTGNSAKLKVSVDNIGADPAINAVLRYDIKKDDFTYGSGSRTISLGASEVQDIEFPWTPFSSGAYTATANISIDNDTNNATNVQKLNFTVSDNISIEGFQVTDKIYADSTLYSTQPITFTGMVMKNGAGFSTPVTFSITGVGVIGSATSSFTGVFALAYSGGTHFDAEGEHEVTATVYTDGKSYTKTDKTDVVAAGSNGTGVVNMIVTPYKLQLEPGKVFDYLISIQSIGNLSGRYILSVNTHSQFEYWLQPEVTYVNLQAGGQEDISLFVNVPKNAPAGEYPITVKLEDMSGRIADVEKVYLEIKDIGQNIAVNNSSLYQTGAEYSVNIVVEPRTLNIKTGEYKEYNVLVQNTGQKTDTYSLDFRTASTISHWFDFDKETVTVSPGKSTYVTLYADIPLDAVVDTYQINVVAEGRSTDSEKVDLVLTMSGNTYDLSLDTPKVTPSGFIAGAVSTVTVTAPVEMTDLKNQGGRYVTVSLYAENTYMESKTVYIASGNTEELEFKLDVTRSPFNSQAGEYDIYYTASIEGEYEKSKKATLTIDELGKPSVSISPETFQTNQNGTIKMNLRVTNPTYTAQDFTIYTKGFSMELDPSNISLVSDETKTIELTGKLNAVPAGNNTSVDIYVSNGEIETFATIFIDVAEGFEELGAEGGLGAGITGYLLTTSGGIAAVIIALFLLAAIIGYYYYSKQDEGVLEGTDDDENNLLPADPIDSDGSDDGGDDSIKAEKGKSNANAKFSQSATAASASVQKSEKGVFSSIKNVFKGKASDGAGETMAFASASAGTGITRGKDCLNLGRFEDALLSGRNSGRESDIGGQKWTAKDAEHVLLNLERMKEDFHNTYGDARTVKDRMHGFARSMESKNLQIQRHIEPERAEWAEREERRIPPAPVPGQKANDFTKPGLGNSYIKSVVDSV